MAIFDSLEGVHQQIRDRLQAHQEALVQGRTEEAREHFQDFARALRAHRESEDDLLFPLYDGTPESSRPGGGLELLEAEHLKLGRLLQDLQRHLADLPDPLPPAARVAWIERERILKEVFDHHDMRERATLHPALDRLLRADPRLPELWAELRRRHREAGLDLPTLTELRL